MSINNIMLAVTAASLAASSAAFADSTKSAPSHKLAHVKRVHAVVDGRKTQNATKVDPLVVGGGVAAAGLGVAAAVGAFNSSK